MPASGRQESSSGTQAVALSWLVSLCAATGSLSGCHEKSAEIGQVTSSAGLEADKPTLDKAAAPQGGKRLAPGPSPAATVTGRAGGPVAKVEAAAAHGPPTDGPRVYALSRNVWVRSAPSDDVQWIGFLWLGGSVRIRGDQRVPGAGCSGNWTPIEPRGWVCVDDRRATTDPNSPMLALLYPLRPRVETPWPHHYAAVHAPLTRYPSLPDEATQRARERGFSTHMAHVREARKTGKGAIFPEHLGQVPFELTGRQPPPFRLLDTGLPDLPPGLSEMRTKMVGRSALAYAADADFGDRAFLLAADMSWVPRDRVELLPQIEFQGIELGEEFQLPLALFRDRDRPAYRVDETSVTKILPDHFKRLSVAKLSGETRRIDGVTYHRLREDDLWVSAREAVIPSPRDKTPWGAPVGGRDETGLAPGGRATWMEASILGGWLVAFEGTRPVYATLISGGRGGIPQKGKDPLETASTPVGRYPITGKFKTATMESSSTPIVHADVPWTQNFSGPHAMHSAYWHDDWGNLKSAGCVNVSPRDGKWLFDYSEPEVPPGWHGVRHLTRHGPATLFIVHE